MPFNSRRAPGGKGAGRLRAGEAKRPRHGVGIEAAQTPDGGGAAKRADHAGAVPAFLAEHRIIEPDADPRRGLEPGGQGHQQVAPGNAVALGNGQRRGHNLRRDMGQGRAMHIAHGDGGNQIAVEDRRPRHRQPAAADHAGLVRLGEGGDHGRHLAGFLSLMPGEGAGERVEQQRLGGMARVRRDGLIGQPGGKRGQGCCRLSCLIGGSGAHRRCPRFYRFGEHSGAGPLPLVPFRSAR